MNLPRKSTAKRRPKEQPLARVMWARNQWQRVGAPLTCYEDEPINGGDRVFLLPADSESFEKMVEVGARAIAEVSRNWAGAFDNDCPPEARDSYRKDSRAALHALGINPPAK